MMSETHTSLLASELGPVVGTNNAKALEKAFGYTTVEEFLHHFPRRYVEVGELTPIAELPYDEHVTIVARVVNTSQRQMHSRKGFIFEVTVSDELDASGQELRMTFFNGYQARSELQHDTVAMFSGKVSWYQDHLQLSQPEYAILDEAAQADPRPIPIYPASAKMPNKKIRDLMNLLMDQVRETDVPEFIPAALLRLHGYPTRFAAFNDRHRPKQVADGYRARNRFAYEEALLLVLSLAERSAAMGRQLAVARPSIPGGLADQFDERLPFELTEEQLLVGQEISSDLSTPHPMHRLLQGEVGSGKTVVALRAILQVIDSGGQAALLAPTEVLATQHFESIRSMLGPLAEPGLFGEGNGTGVALLTGSAKTAQRKEALLGIASGQTGLIIGTHALLGDQVQFADLGLVVIDEQHRFGVEQRDALRAKANNTVPHTLVMTATPIPRTVAMTVFGDLEISTIRRMPFGRAPITTHLVPMQLPGYQQRLFQRMAEEVSKGHQVYVVCPRITDSQTEPGSLGVTAEGSGNDPMSVEAMFELVNSIPLFNDIRVEALHSQLPTEDKHAIMEEFSSGEVDILISTTVIEVGVDVHNATLMVIIDAENFGISQLHQLRGRVGRGGLPGTCLLTTWLDADHPSVNRLRTVEGSTDGFELAEADLAERKEGNILGVQQSGSRSSLRVLSVMKDQKIIERARKDVGQLTSAAGWRESYPLLAVTLGTWVDEATREFLDKN
ncbi:ATP-dependent DNA helicase RecG [Glutamicibacter sp. MNS18]|uniref:ATP-dependent DNA helicase RecG n=1 Tax=Glutamicibacter sp. MNS18 TaxID=2989817 RepID=UPI002236565F|nr:ATP-dependent DNA helicase RecG [Glutamicibacter sp. MNS18]MCW4466194.1 ATP-dependent DNA helicase RecG [Glutamicibacter sp. MNS18]